MCLLDIAVLHQFGVCCWFCLGFFARLDCFLRFFFLVAVLVSWLSGIPGLAGLCFLASWLWLVCFLRFFSGCFAGLLAVWVSWVMLVCFLLLNIPVWLRFIGFGLVQVDAEVDVAVCECLK